MMSGKFLLRLFDCLYGKGLSGELTHLASSYAALNTNIWCQPRILACVPESIDYKEFRQMLRELYSSSDKAIHFEVVEIGPGKLINACRAAKKILKLPEKSLISADGLVNIQPGDVSNIKFCLQ